jgi:hypothetical protein
MTEKEAAGPAEGRSKTKPTGASRAKKTTAKPARRTAAGEPATLEPYQDDLYERIRRRAYELWEGEGRPAGRDQANWLQAEREVARARAERGGISR